MQIIGISGKMGVGKTTVARMLCELIPGAERIAFGDILKREMAGIFGVPLGYFYDRKEMNVAATPERRAAGMTQSMTVRELMQWYGTEVVRKENPDYWVHAMREKLRNMRATGVPVAIIDDVRFPNEAALIKELGGSLIRINPYQGYEKDSAHLSETALDAYAAWDACFAPEYGEVALSDVAGTISKTFKKTP